jgi:hypothetical protein
MVCGETKGQLIWEVLMDKLIQDAKRLAGLENAYPGLVSRPLLAYLNEWLAFEDKRLIIPNLRAALVDGLDIDFTGTKWEREWLANDKVCYCDACVIARECLADIKRTAK